jgi:hypothetical protein
MDIGGYGSRVALRLPGTTWIDSLFKELNEHKSAFPRREAPGFWQKPFAQEIRGRRECRVPNAPAASRAKLSEAHERSHHGHTGFKPGIPRAMVLTAYTVLSPASEFLLSPSLAD